MSGGNYGYSGPSPGRSPGKHRGYLVKVSYTLDENGLSRNWLWQRKQKETEKSVSINRYIRRAIEDASIIVGCDVDYFWKTYTRTLVRICKELSVEATKKLRRLIAERAYTTLVSYDDNTATFGSAESYLVTGEFLKSWIVVVSVGDGLQSLRFNIIYNYDSMTAAPPPAPHYFPIHESFRGTDYRRALADILNESWSFWRDNGTYADQVTRLGGWQEEFDRWCRGELYDLFLDMCDERING